MRYLIFTAALFVSINMYGQIKPQYKDIFLRVYNLEGKKIAKGKLVLITNSSMVLVRRRKRIEIQLEAIYKIRTKRSFGNNVIIGTAIGGGALAVILAESGSTDSSDSSYFSFTPLDGAIAGTIIGGAFGTGIGAITGLFKNSKVYIIKRDPKIMKSFKDLVLKNE